MIIYRTDVETDNNRNVLLTIVMLAKIGNMATRGNIITASTNS